jgi:hypothetical protein
MRRWASRRPSPALIVALIALVVATAGTTYAVSVPKKSVGPKQLRAGAVKTPKLATGAVTGAKIGPGAVSVGQLGPGAVTAAKLGPTVARFSAPMPLNQGAEGNATVQCATGERLIAGGGQVDEPGPDTPIVLSRPALGLGGDEPANGGDYDAWRVRAVNENLGATGDTTLRAWAICLR